MNTPEPDKGLGCHDEQFRCSRCLCCSICECTETGFNCGKDRKKSVSPADMQDGKRYRVVFDGIYHQFHLGSPDNTGELISFDPAVGDTTIVCLDDLLEATHIVEIGGDS